MRCSKALTPLVTGLTMVALSTEALADPIEETREKPRRHRTSEILTRIEMPRGETRSWLEEHVSIRKGMGLAYHYKVETEDHRKVILSVGGPALKKKRLGLMFEVRF
ncbi:MAG: hypothetical protein ACHQ3O_07910 [Candidatus Limnocylindria bacterium]|jgi:hypothetical protein